MITRVLLKPLLWLFGGARAALDSMAVAVVSQKMEKEGYPVDDDFDSHPAIIIENGYPATRALEHGSTASPGRDLDAW